MDSEQYGDLKIIHYSNVDIYSGLEQLRSDLIQTTIKYEVNPDFSDFYKNILTVNKLLGYSEHSNRYLELYLKSQQLTRRYLNMPVSQKQKF